MGTIYLVRHGQAAFGTDDYDRLTEIGHKQSQLLGCYFKKLNIQIDHVVTGTLKRHEQTADGILSGLMLTRAAERFEQLNEYNPDALLEAYLGKPFETPAHASKRDPELVKAHFRLLRSALMAWTSGDITPRGMPSFNTFQQGTLEVINDYNRRYPESNILIASSGGPISAALSGLLNAPTTTAIDLNLRIRNTGVSEISLGSQRPYVIAMNNVAHLQTVDDTLITYA